MTTRSRLAKLAERWADVTPAERANYQLYLSELAEALDVPKPQPAGSGYQFELPIQMVNPDGTTTTRFADLVKNGFFLLEAKDADSGKSNDLLLRRAFGQAAQYTAFLKNGQPPYLLVLDVGTTLLVWDRWNGTYGGFQAAHRIDLKTLHERPADIELLQDVWTKPAARDPRAKANAVTREIATKLAKLAASLEERGYSNERVAKFLMRCVFTMFSEDVDLLPDEPFKGAVALGLEHPSEFESATQELWAAMDEGRRFGLKKLLRFNGHFFKEQEVIPLTRSDMVVLHEAAQADWAQVEPTIFGTLLTRALDPAERHKLGAEYTPREYVERLVRPTIDEPLRERWALVQAEVLQLRERGRPVDRKRAVERLRAFHEYLRGLRVLDPACGSGNFLYVALATIKAIELEVLREIEAITGMPELAVEEVGPWQFHGIEIKPWARELAELTLWVGYYQWWRQTHGHTLPPEPVLRETGTLECRDAVLAWDEIRELPERSRPDPTPRIPDPVTGALIPDPDARLPYHEHVGAREAQWPRADFIVGNPPYLGNKRMREVFGDGYVAALRDTYEDVPGSADYVMYWWHRAARAIGEGNTIRAGLITTNTIVQGYNRQVVETAAAAGAHVVWAVSDHPWVDDSGSADVRVALTVLSPKGGAARTVTVDAEGSVVAVRETKGLNSDLTSHADVPTAAGTPLRANAGLASVGFWLVGDGFRLDHEEGAKLLAMAPSHREVVRPLVSGRDLAKRNRGQYTVDFGLRSEAEAQQFPVLYDLVRSRVRPHREANNDPSARENWWLFGRARAALREALTGLPRFIAIPETGKHTVFQFLGAEVAAEHAVVCIASDDAYVLGVLSSTIHVEWAQAAGGRLGVGNDPRYQKARCFDAFPFPAADEAQVRAIRVLGERLVQHRSESLARSDRVTITGMYNVLGKLRSGAPLTASERELHTVAACGTLKDIHDELDLAVAAAYGWPWPLESEGILDRLVALHDVRVKEEERGMVRWVRAEFQRDRFGINPADLVPGQAIDLPSSSEPSTTTGVTWPEEVASQLEVIRGSLGESPLSLRGLAQRFPAARRSEIMAHVEALMILGIVSENDDGEFMTIRSHAVFAT